MGWFFVTIVTPLLLPVLGILPLMLLRFSEPTPGLRVMATVKDGQLGWGVIAMSAAAMYEVWQAMQCHHLPDWIGALFFGVALVMLPAVLLAAGGAAFSTPLLDGKADVRRWISHYKVFAWSFGMTLIVVTVYTYLHFTIEALGSCQAKCP